MRSEPTTIAAQGAPLPRLEELVPHRAPMLLLDRLLAHDAESAVCEVRIGPRSLFFEGEPAREGEPGRGRVPAVVGLEYMAQCVAAYAGLVARAAGTEPRLGFLVGCRELVLEVDGFGVGDVLEVTARRLWGESHVGSFACHIAREGQTIVKGTLTVYQGPLSSLDEEGATK